MNRTCSECGWRGGEDDFVCPKCLGITDADALPEDEDEGEAHAGPVPIDTASPERVYLRASISRALDGLRMGGSLVLVHGAPGAGKSREVAAACWELMHERRARVDWLDAEMDDAEYAEIWRGAGATETARRVTADSWQAAMRLVRARVVVVDSLDEWTPKEDPIEMLAALRAKARRGALVFVIRQHNAKGRMVGATRILHYATAEVEITPEQAKGGPKCKWSKSAGTVDRADGGDPWATLGVRRGDRDGARRAWRAVAKVDHVDLHQASPPDVRAAAAQRYVRATVAWQAIEALG